MIDAPEEEKRFMAEANLIFDQAEEVSSNAPEANRGLAFASAIMLMVKAMRRSPHNIRLEWEIDPELFIQDAIAQARNFSMRIRRNIELYDKERVQAEEEAGLPVQEAINITLGLFGDKDFLAYFRAFMANMMSIESMLEDKFMREWD